MGCYTEPAGRSSAGTLWETAGLFKNHLPGVWTNRLIQLTEETFTAVH